MKNKIPAWQFSFKPNKIDLSFRQKVAESILGEISPEGFCCCPGEHLHTNRTNKNSCRVYLDETPTIHCMHESCKEVVEQANKKLRFVIFSKAKNKNLKFKQQRRTREEIVRVRQSHKDEALRIRTENALPLILQEYEWTYHAIGKSSPIEVNSIDPPRHAKLLLKLFESNDVVWIGDKYSSSLTDKTYNRFFRRAKEWALLDNIPWQFICPCTFKSGTHSRSNQNVLCERFLVVESDYLSKNEVGSIFQWLRKKAGLKLRAIVDTGNKSLHAWFDWPDKEILRQLKIILPALKCDGALMRSTQPVRLPGVLRTEEIYQKLIFYRGK